MAHTQGKKSVKTDLDVAQTLELLDKEIKSDIYKYV